MDLATEAAFQSAISRRVFVIFLVEEDVMLWIERTCLWKISCVNISNVKDILLQKFSSDS